MMRKSELSQKEIATINCNYGHVDSLYKRFGGVSTSLEGYIDGILYLRITNRKHKIPPSYYTALRYAHSWKDFNPELKDALGFVTFFMDADANGVDAVPENHSKKELNGYGIGLLDETKKDIQTPSEIFSGLLSNEQDDVEQALERDINNFGVGDDEISKLSDKEKLKKMLFSRGHVSFLDSSWIREIYRRMKRMDSDKELIEAYNSCRIKYSNLYLSAKRMSIIEEFERRGIDFNCISRDNGKSISFKNRVILINKGSKKYLKIDSDKDTDKG